MKKKSKICLTGVLICERCKEVVYGEKSPIEIKDKHYILNFGKHKGKTIKEVTDINPNYLIWCEKKEIIVMSQKLHSKVLIAVSKMHDYYSGSCDYGRPRSGHVEHKTRKLMEPHYSEEDKRTYYEQEYQGEVVKCSYNDDKTTTVYWGGPCGPAQYDEFGNYM